MVGVNCHRLDAEDAIPLLTVDNSAVLASQMAKLDHLEGQSRSRRRRSRARGAGAGARGRENLLELSVRAARAHATVGEISLAMEKVFGRHRARAEVVRGVYAAEVGEGAAITRARGMIAAFAEADGRPPAILIAKMGQDGHDRGQKVIATGFDDLGFSVDVGALFATPAEARARSRRARRSCRRGEFAGRRSPDADSTAEGGIGTAGPRRHHDRRRRRDPAGRFRDAAASGRAADLPAGHGRGRSGHRRENEATSVASQQQALDEHSAARFRVLEASLAETHAAARALETRAVMAEDVLLVRTEELRVVLDELDSLRTAFVEHQDAAAAQAEVPVVSIDPALIESLSVMSSRAERAEMAIARLEADLTHAGELHSRELHSLETALRERAQAIQLLDREIARRERLVQELVGTVEELRDQVSFGETETRAAAQPSATAGDHGSAAPVSVGADSARLRGQVEQLSLEIARREGELEARAWRISELEREVGLLSQSLHGAEERASRAMEHAPTVHYSGELRDPRDSDEAREVARLRLELDALRQALAQEHAEKKAEKQQADQVRTESASLLEEARAELARQTVLVEQLSRELAARAS